MSRERTEARLALVCSTVWSLLVALVLHEKPRYVFFPSSSRSRIEAYNTLFVLHFPSDCFLFPLSQCPPFARRVNESSRERVGKKKCRAISRGIKLTLANKSEIIQQLSPIINRYTCRDIRTVVLLRFASKITRH